MFAQHAVGPGSHPSSLNSPKVTQSVVAFITNCQKKKNRQYLHCPFSSRKKGDMHISSSHVYICKNQLPSEESLCVFVGNVGGL